MHRLGLFGWRRNGAVALATAGMCGLLPGAAAAALPPGCSQSGPIVSCTQTFTSGSNPFTVPAGVSSIHVQAVGGAGFGGGLGALVSGVLPVTGPKTLWALVGGNGSVSSGGANGGGNGTDTFPPFVSGGGGGASDVRTSQTDLSTRLLVAAGGGGDGAGAFGSVNAGLSWQPLGGGGTGGDAGMAGGNGSDVLLPPTAVSPQGTTLSGGGGGAAGTATMGGAPGATFANGVSCSVAGGGLGFGGSPSCPGGGGGGGLFGGGSGGLGEFGGITGALIVGLAGSGGGGGGSNLVPPGGSQSVDTTGVPMVQISYKLIPTSKDQCTNRGWRHYPQFKNQGDCISFVNNGR